MTSAPWSPSHWVSHFRPPPVQTEAWLVVIEIPDGESPAPVPCVEQSLTTSASPSSYAQGASMSSTGKLNRPTPRRRSDGALDGIARHNILAVASV